MNDMDNPNLILKFKLRGETDARIVGASRIRVDGRGGLTLYPLHDGIPERINLDLLQSFAVRLFRGAEIAVSA
jgi:hypothetical protein